MLNITLDLDTGLAKLAAATTIKAGAQVPVTISTFRGATPASPGSSPAFELGLGTDATPPVIKAYLATFSAENSHTFTGVLDVNDTRLVAFMAGKGTVNFGCEVAWTVAGELQVAPSFPVPVQSRIIPSDPTSEGGPDFYTEAEVDALLAALTANVAAKAALAGATFTGAINEAAGTNLASASTTNIAAATGNLVTITGTTAITALGTVAAGAQRTCIFAGILTLTHNGTSLILPTGANITTAAGDVVTFRSLGSGHWRCTGYTRADGTALAGSGGGPGVQFAEGTLLGWTDPGMPEYSGAAAFVAIDFAAYDEATNIVFTVGDLAGITIHPGNFPEGMPAVSGYTGVAAGTVYTYTRDTVGLRATFSDPGGSGVVITSDPGADPTSYAPPTGQVTTIEIAPAVAGKTLILLSPNIIGEASGASSWNGVINVSYVSSGVFFSVDPAALSAGSVVLDPARINPGTLLHGEAALAIAAEFVPTTDILTDMAGGSVSFRIPYIIV